MFNMRFSIKVKFYILIVTLIASKSFNAQTIQLFKPPYNKQVTDSAERMSTFYIRGGLQGIDSGKVILYSGENVIDTVSIVKGKIEILGKTDETQLISLKVLGDYYIHSFFAEN